MEFEGTEILEKISEIGQLDEFFDAVDSDDFDRVKYIMKKAGVTTEMRAWVIKKMKEA